MQPVFTIRQDKKIFDRVIEYAGGIATHNGCCFQARLPKARILSRLFVTATYITTKLSFSNTICGKKAGSNNLYAGFFRKNLIIKKCILITSFQPFPAIVVSLTCTPYHLSSAKFGRPIAIVVWLLLCQPHIIHLPHC